MGITISNKNKKMGNHKGIVQTSQYKIKVGRMTRKLMSAILMKLSCPAFGPESLNGSRSTDRRIWALIRTQKHHVNCIIRHFQDFKDFWTKGLRRH